MVVTLQRLMAAASRFFTSSHFSFDTIMIHYTVPVLTDSLNHHLAHNECFIRTNGNYLIMYYDSGNAFRAVTYLLMCDLISIRVAFVVGQRSRLKARGPGSIPRSYKIFWEVVGMERGPLSFVSTIEELLGRKISGSGLEIRDYGRRDPRADHATSSIR
jgi:hypothetical protein